MDKRVELAERAVAAADKEVESAQKALDAEIEARNNGYANNVETAQKELDLAKKNQAKALKEQQKAQKAQEAIDTATQVSSLVTAVAKIWAATAVQPWLAASLTALMFASFIAAKIKAAQVTKANASESYGEGTVELLSGGSHQSGRDVDLGYTPDGRRRRAEGGEFFAVINKRNSRRYRHVVPNVIRSLNNGTFEQQYGRAFDINRTENTFNSGYESPDLRDLQDDVRAIRDQNKRRIYTDAAGNTVIVFRNSKRTIKKS